nr:SseB family protein [uncultured Lachnoanaerobaculum sp.]
MFWDKIKDAFSSEKSVDDNKEIKPVKGRFTMLVKGCKDEGSVLLEGDVYGTVKKENVTVLFKDGKVSHLKIARLIDSAGNDCESVTDAYANIGFESIDKGDDFKYALITNIDFQIESDVNKAVENPYILGLLYEYDNYYKDEDFVNLFFREMVMSHYLLPIHMSGDFKSSGETVLKKDTKINIYGINLEGGVTALPVFTDWTALKNWADKGPANWKQETIIVRFPDILGCLKNEGGFIINPYGPQSFYMNSENINNIVNSSGYQSQFGDAKIETKVAKGGEKNFLGYPPDNEEVAAIKKRLVAFGNAHSEINLIDMMLRVDETGTKSYLIITDIDDSDVRKYYKDIYNSCRDLLREVVYLDFATLKQADFAKDKMNPTPLYKKS